MRSEGRSTLQPSGKIRVRPDRVVTLSERLYLLRSASRRERIKFANNDFRIAVIFARRHQAEATVSFEDDYADHEGRGEVPGSDLRGVKGLRHLRLLCLGEGHPRSTCA